MAEREVSADRGADRSAVAGVPRGRRRTDECMLVHGLCATAIALTALRALSTTVVAAVHACLFGLYDAWSTVRLIAALAETARGLLRLLGRCTSSVALCAARFARRRSRHSVRPVPDRADAEDQQAHGSSGSRADAEDQQAHNRSGRREHKPTARTGRGAAAGDAWTPLLQVAGRGLRSFFRRGRAARPSRPGRAASATFETAAVRSSTHYGTADQRPQHRYAIEEYH